MIHAAICLYRQRPKGEKYPPWSVCKKEEYNKFVMNVEIFLGTRRIHEGEIAHYRCINDYVGDVVNEAYARLCRAEERG